VTETVATLAQDGFLCRRANDVGAGHMTSRAGLGMLNIAMFHSAYPISDNCENLSSSRLAANGQYGNPKRRCNTCHGRAAEKFANWAILPTTADEHAIVTTLLSLLQCNRTAIHRLKAENSR